MLDRNRRLKPRPERFQDCNEKFDVVFTVDERVYDQVIEGKFIIYSLKIIHNGQLCSKIVAPVTSLITLGAMP